ncbi:MAG: ABC transporter substrate-binding protein [Rhodospirillales bacterium]|nr:ABC transporter substrate-binding protein [Rhodospirillales bacterium]
MTAGAMLVLAALPGAAEAQSGGKTLRFVPEADLRVLDPIWTTAYITRNHGYMVYDTLIAIDKDFKPQPQMVDKWEVSGDKLKWTFTLRDGLKFHDGQPVRSADCIASLQRWMKRDPLGQKLAEAVAGMEAANDKIFSISLKKPFPLLLEAIGKPSSNVPFIMPERLARTDAFTQVKEAIGSGPFKFVAEEWVPGNKVVYVKNTDYVPRKEPPSWASGGKVVKVDRVEWIYIPDGATAAAALQAGEVDWWQQVPSDLAPLLQRSKDVVVTNVDPIGSHGIIRFNHLLPPFDNEKARQALLYVVDQKEYMTAVAADQKNWQVCASYFTCGTPMANDAGSEVLTGKRDVEKAKQLVKESGYDGRPVVVMSATDQPIVHNQALVTAELLKKIGFNVDFQAVDWGTLVTRRASKEPVDKGGWNIFHTWWVGTDVANPAVNAPLRGNGGNAWFGWPTNAKLEQLRDDWFAAPDLDAQKKIAAEMQKEAFRAVPYIPTGQFVIPTAFRKNLEGVIVAPIAFLWNVEKK